MRALFNCGRSTRLGGCAALTDHVVEERAAMDAGVEFIATDQYEAFAAEWTDRALER